MANPTLEEIEAKARQIAEKQSGQWVGWDGAAWLYYMGLAKRELENERKNR